MIDWARLTLVSYIFMRMTGFVLFDPILGRRGIPGIARAGYVLVLTFTVASFTATADVPLPDTVLEFGLRLCLELALGFLAGLVVQIFFYIPLLAGETIDSQMGLGMAQTYDAGSQVSASVTSTTLNVLIFLLFFAGNGPHTLLRILLTSGELIPYGRVALGADAADLVAMLFITCTTLGVKLAFPILAAEMIGEVGMGILLKVIPQINVFVINIDMKILIGLTMLLLLIFPFSEFLLDVENQMLYAVGQAIAAAG